MLLPECLRAEGFTRPQVQFRGRMNVYCKSPPGLRTPGRMFVGSWSNMAPIPTGSPLGSFLGFTTDVPWEINFLIQCHGAPTSETNIKSALDSRDQKVRGWKMLN